MVHYRCIGEGCAAITTPFVAAKIGYLVKREIERKGAIATYAEYWLCRTCLEQQINPIVRAYNDRERAADDAIRAAQSAGVIERLQRDADGAYIERRRLSDEPQRATQDGEAGAVGHGQAERGESPPQSEAPTDNPDVDRLFTSLGRNDSDT